MQRLDIARYLIFKFPPLIRGEGTKRVLLAPAPSPWLLNLGELRLGFTEGVFLRSSDPAPCALLDVWAEQGKVFSTCWMPDKPWLPPTVISLKRGVWLKAVGYLDR
jgi:hypothetical protein